MMHDITTMAISVFMGFFAMMNPIANTAVFIGMTANQNQQQRKNTTIKALLTAFLIITAFCLLGKGIFEVFGITLPALRISGGILVFIVGYHMLNGRTSNLHSRATLPPDDDDIDIAISPLAIPILAGPGTIATAMNYSASGEMLHIVITIIIFAILCLITFACFLYGAKLIEKIGEAGVSITTRLMGLILTIIGTQMFIQGVHDAYILFQSAKIGS
ncbi:MarC family protein [Terasakiispira papahanaumokuakeensis]|nr:MarC family protein [Terasakiispira papahanaumokuakeensis]